MMCTKWWRDVRVFHVLKDFNICVFFFPYSPLFFPHLSYDAIMLIKYEFDIAIKLLE